jgi:protein involved in polysaccharide export with SLBB domain
MAYPLSRCFLPALLVATALQPAVHVGAAAADGAYLLGSGDKLRINADEWPALGGEFTVGPDGALSLPIVGATAASGVSAADLAKIIGRRMSEKSKTSGAVNVNVEIVRYRPFFVTGDVQRPGEYEYQPGITVLKAVTKAGGFFRLESAGLLRLERDSITARGTILTLEQKAARLRARALRLEAELEDRDKLVLPEKYRNDTSFQRLVEQEQALLTIGRDALEQKISAQEGAKRISEQEIGSLSLQIEEETKQLNFVKKEADKIRSLQERGLASSPRLLDLDRNIAQITSARQGIRTQILRARHEIHRAEQKILELRHAQKVAVQEELQRVSDELKETSELIKTQTELLVESDVSAPRAARAAEESGVQRRYRIVREGGSEVAAEEASKVSAGDVIKVERINRASFSAKTQ